MEPFWAGNGPCGPEVGLSRKVAIRAFRTGQTAIAVRSDTERERSVFAMLGGHDVLANSSFHCIHEPKLTVRSLYEARGQPTRIVPLAIIRELIYVSAAVTHERDAAEGTRLILPNNLKCILDHAKPMVLEHHHHRGAEVCHRDRTNEPGACA